MHKSKRTKIQEFLLSAVIIVLAVCMQCYVLVSIGMGTARALTVNDQRTVAASDTHKNKKRKPVEPKNKKAFATNSPGRWEMPEADIGENLIKNADAQTKTIDDKKKADADAAKAKADAEAQAKAEQATESEVSRSAARDPLPDDTVASGPGAADAQAYAKSVMSASDYSCLANIVSRESGWNVHAVNPSSGAYGLGQSLPGSKMASFGGDWQSNGVTQIKWVISYVNGRYGSPCGAWSFWQANNWY